MGWATKIRPIISKNKMTNSIVWFKDKEGFRVIRMTGTGEYIKKECTRLIKSIEDAELDHLEEIRQDYEHDQSN